MPLDTGTRNALAGIVGSCRARLTDDVGSVFEGEFGLLPNGTRLEVEQLTHLSESGRAKASFLREWQDHLSALEKDESEDERRKGALQRMIHETAFTALNRLVALRLCEERGYVFECVRRGTESEGFRLFERLSGGVLGSRGQTYRFFLTELFRDLAIELGVLFDVDAPQSVVMPGSATLEAVLGELGAESIAHVWEDDETIGWVFQYFNSAKEREDMRKASAAPRNSRELAVRNQFFTPRYVVEFLVDNTLGALWYDMCCGETEIAKQCKLLAPDDCRDQLGKARPNARSRTKKDPRDLRLIDPACGSGHFLLYAFDVLVVIYGEAWADPDAPRSKATGRTLRQDYPTKEALTTSLPKLAMEFNLCGVDIDRRAAQVCDLALRLRAMRFAREQGTTPALIGSSRVVCAEPVADDPEVLREFIDAARPRVLGELTAAIIDAFRLVGELGVLLKIERELSGAVRAARVSWETPTLDFSTSGPASSAAQTTADTDASLHDFWATTDEALLNAFAGFAATASSDQSARRRWFSSDARGAVGLLELCLDEYDVVLMNPPFGKLPPRAEKYARREYRDTWKDAYACFIDRARELAPRGFIGAVTSSLFLYTKQLRGLRERWAYNEDLRILVELGPSVLDGATVDIALTVTAPASSGWTRCLDLVDDENKGATLESAARNPEAFMFRKVATYRSIDGFPFAYHLDPRAASLWTISDRLQPLTAEVVNGNHTFDDFRFLRLRWEVPPIHLSNRWFGYEKGGEYHPYLAPTSLVYKWQDDGAEARAFQVGRYGTDAQVLQSRSWWFAKGITYPRISSVGFSPRVMPSGHIFSGESISVFPLRDSEQLPLLSFLASTPCASLLQAFGRYRKIENRAVAGLPLSRSTFEQRCSELGECGSAILAAALKALSLDETTPFFGSLAGACSSLTAPRRALVELESQLKSHIERTDRVVEEMLYGVATPLPAATPRAELVSRWVASAIPTDAASAGALVSFCLGSALGRFDVRLATGERCAGDAVDPFAPLPACAPGMLTGDDGLPLGATPAGYPLRISWDGVLVDDPGLEGGPHPEDIVTRVREVLALLWGARAEEIEHEACELLGAGSLRDFFRRPSGFFAEHLKRYSKSRRQAPIYWPLATASGSYALWLYYPRLDEDLLYTAVNRYLEPKMTAVGRRLADLDLRLPVAMGKEATELRGEHEELTVLQRELNDLRAELLRVAALPYKPNLDDGVLISAAPLARLFRLTKWRKDLEVCWKNLERGDYDWAHLAMGIWPERVREACRRDRSIAIAHGVEGEYWE